MKLFELRDGFGLEQLLPGERPDPEPGPREVLVRIRAVSLNYRDLLVVEGRYNPRMQLPRVPFSDGAGEIAAVGADVTGWKTGDRVVIPFFPAWREGALTRDKAASALGGDVDGVLREYVTVPADCLLPIPEHLDFMQAATLPCAAVTAWNGLFVAGALQPGQTVLLQGTGGVSLFGLQLARAAGARTILISSSDAKLERARALGADETINYQSDARLGKGRARPDRRRRRRPDAGSRRRRDAAPDPARHADRRAHQPHRRPRGRRAATCRLSPSCTRCWPCTEFTSARARCSRS